MYLKYYCIQHYMQFCKIHTFLVRVMQSSTWAPVLRPKTSKTLFGQVNYSAFFKKYIKINTWILFGPVNSNFHFEDCMYVIELLRVQDFFCILQEMHQHFSSRTINVYFIYNTNFYTLSCINIYFTKTSLIIKMQENCKCNCFIVLIQTGACWIHL